MFYSIWNYGKKAYDYYEGPSDGRTHAGTPPRARGAKELGATPEQAAWPLPARARKIGSGAEPRGRIASLGGTTDGIDLSSPATLGLIGVAAYFAWKAFR